VIKGLYAGVSAEAGNTWAFGTPATFSGMKGGGSFFVVADTLIGPLFIGYGHSSQQQQRVPVPESELLGEPKSGSS
jgi:NTE family protein